MDQRNDTTILECYNITENTYGPLKVIKHNLKKISFFLLWNEFTVLVKHISHLSLRNNLHFPNFFIKYVYLHQNILLCLDQNGNLHVTTVQKNDEINVLEKLEFKQILKDVIYVTNYESDIFVASKKNDHFSVYHYNVLNACKIKVHHTYKLKTSSLFKNIISNFKRMIVLKLRYFSIDFIENIFKIEISKIDLDSPVLLFVRDDNLYWSVLNSELNDVNILYSSPAKINNVFINRDTNIKISIALETGTIILLSYNGIDKCLDYNSIHLNCCLIKVNCDGNVFLYSDCHNLYIGRIEFKIDEYQFTSQKIIPVHFPNDFMLTSDEFCVYATTVHNNVYKITVDIQTEDQNGQKDITIPKNFSCAQDVMDEIKKEMKSNKVYLNLIDNENDYLSIFFLGSKQNLLQSSMDVKFQANKYYGCLDYEREIILCDGRFNERIINTIEINFDKNLQQKFEMMLKNINNLFFVNTQTISEKWLDIHNTSLIIDKTPKLAIGTAKSITNLPVTIKMNFISLVPGINKHSHKYWCIIKGHQTVIDATYFISSECVVAEKKQGGNISFDESVCSMFEKNWNLLCDVVKDNTDTNDRIFSFYIKLPDSFKNLSNEFAKLFALKLSPKCAAKVISKIVDLNFVQGHKPVTFFIFDVPLNLEIEICDSNEEKIKISSTQIGICVDIYKFIVNIFKVMRSNTKSRCVAHFDYVILKNLIENTDNIQDCSRIINKNVLLEILDSFNRDVLGILPVLSKS